MSSKKSTAFFFTFLLMPDLMAELNAPGLFLPPWLATMEVSCGVRARLIPLNFRD